MPDLPGARGRGPAAADPSRRPAARRGPLARPPRRPAARAARQPGGRRWRLRHDPLMLVMVVTTAVVIAAIGGINVIEVFFIRETLGGSTTTYGLVSAAWMAGMLPGSLARRATRQPARRRRRAGRGVLVTLAVCSLMVLLAATVPAALCWCRSGWSAGGQRRRERLRQPAHRRRVPEASRGRAYASYGAAVQGGSMAGFLVGGALLAVPPRPLIAGAGVAGLWWCWPSCRSESRRAGCGRAESPTAAAAVADRAVEPGRAARADAGLATPGRPPSRSRTPGIRSGHG